MYSLHIIIHVEPSLHSDDYFIYAFSSELLHDEPMPGQCCGVRMKRSKVAVTQITIVKGEGLVPEDKSSCK